MNAFKKDEKFRYIVHSPKVLYLFDLCARQCFCLVLDLVELPGVLGRLVNDGDSLETGEEVLELAVLVVTFSSSQVVEPWDLQVVMEVGSAGAGTNHLRARTYRVQEVVDQSHDNEHSEGESPDTDNSDNVGPATVVTLSVDGGIGASEPSEETEDGGQDVDSEDGADQLPRWPCPASVGTGDEDEPVLGKGDLQEEDSLNVSEVLDDTSVVDVESSPHDPGTGGEQASHCLKTDDQLSVVVCEDGERCTH